MSFLPALQSLFAFLCETAFRKRSLGLSISAGNYPDDAAFFPGQVHSLANNDCSTFVLLCSWASGASNRQNSIQSSHDRVAPNPGFGVETRLPEGSHTCKGDEEFTNIALFSRDDNLCCPACHHF